MDHLARLPDQHLLLAYGTLKEDEPIHGDASVPEVRTVRRGLRIPGRLFDVGAYPAAVLDHAALRGERPVTATFVCDLVQVVVPRIVVPGDPDKLDRRADDATDHAALALALEATLAAYDAYEDDSYRRIAILIDDPVHRNAWIYEWVEDTSELPLIPSGVWSSGERRLGPERTTPGQ